MLDSMNAPALPKAILRADYSPPDWLVPDINLDFDLDPDRTKVRAIFHVVRNGQHDRPLKLDGDGLSPLAVRVDGKDSTDWSIDNDSLVIALAANSAQIETEVEIAPAANSKLMGLYASGGMLCTQCEAEGFRRITFFPDRPDILSRYRVVMHADQMGFPILLSNGDLTASGKHDDGRHWAEWTDPFPKPSYLFALVAGDLSANRDHFTTMSGKRVALNIWVKAADLPRTQHAMEALKLSMEWDERVYGREYDLGEFNIVAVSDFNFGAMENKSLNIFNTNFVLADPETATDIDYDNVLGVVAHEYFHNWSGNRVTCRDWFQLSLKEGFTVFRDQSFSADQGSAAVKRIQDVRILRGSQFQEDAGPLAHPIRPDSYIEISNFYTATIYNKGAEVIRMLHTMLGAEAFRAGSDLYFDRHDGEAATCEDFVKAMEDASGTDLGQFRRWYQYAGTPRIKVELTHDATNGTATLNLTQSIPDTPGQSGKGPLAIPLKLAFFDPSTGLHGGEELVLLSETSTTIQKAGFAAPPILSINRDFSAPVIIDAKRSADDLAFLSAHDDDPFGRYEAMQQLMVDTLVGAIQGHSVDHAPVVRAVRNTLTNNALDPAFIAEAVLLPSEAFVGDQMLVVDPDAVHAAREALRTTLGRELANEWRAAHARHAQAGYVYTPQAKGARRMRNVALSYVMASGAGDAGGIALDQYSRADNMTDQLAALGALANSDTSERLDALADFYEQYRHDPLVLDKWFSTQAFSTRQDTVEMVQQLAKHPDFTLSNPNRVRSLVAAFTGNQQQFNVASGAGYRFVTDMIIALDPINPQVAARQVPALGRWRRFGDARQALMKAELQRILDTPGVSKDVFEQASKSLG